MLEQRLVVTMRQVFRVDDLAKILDRELVELLFEQLMEDIGLHMVFRLADKYQMSDLTRLRRLSGIPDEYLDGDEEALKLDDARADREVKIKQLIQTAFKRIGLDVDMEYIAYTEDYGREARIGLEDSTVDIAVLSRLNNTGLSDRFDIDGSSNGLTVEFKVSAALDQAV